MNYTIFSVVMQPVFAIEQKNTMHNAHSTLCLLIFKTSDRNALMHFNMQRGIPVLYNSTMVCGKEKCLKL